MGFVDLHVHSDVSDGTLSPAEVTRLALETGLDAYALTDHDTTDGIDEAMEAARGTPLEVVPGTELSCIFDGKEIHILGLYIDHRSPALSKALTQLQKDRDSRNDEMLGRFRKDGFLITKEDLNGGDDGAVMRARAK